MALLVGELKAALGLDESGFNKGLDASEAKFGRFGKKLETEADRAGKNVAGRFGVGLHGAIGSVVSRSAGIVAAGFAAWGSVKILGSFVNDARESAKVGRLTAAAIKSTGGAAKISADQVGDLATAISNKTGADDEAIQSGENLLLTFTGIRNEVGKGNDIFNQASSMITDMTAALNDGDVSASGMKASSIQLGKALNDPIKGVSALQKVGVSFTESQKKQIKTMVDSGNTMGAQKVILAELSKEFGGAAAAASDPLQKLEVVVGNVKETIGTAFLPVVDKAAKWLGENLPGAVDTAGKFFSERLLPPVRTVVSFFSDHVIPIAKNTVTEFLGLGQKILTAIGPIDLSGIAGGIFDDTKAWAGSVISGLKAGLDTGDWKPLGKSLGDGVVRAVHSLGDKSGAILDAVGGLIDKVDWKALGGKVSAGITGLFAGVDWKGLGSSLGDAAINVLGKSSDLGVKLGTAFKDVVNKIDWKKIGESSTGAIIGFVSGVDWGQVAKALGVALFKSLKIDVQIKDAIIKGSADLVVGMFKAIIDAMSIWRVNVTAYVKQVGGDLVAGLWSGIRGAMKGVGGFLKSVVVDPVVGWVKSLFGVHSPSTVFAGIGSALIAGLKGGIVSAATGIGRWVYSNVISPVVAPFGKAGRWLVQYGRNAVAGFKDGVSAIARGIGRWMYSNVISPAVAPFGKAGAWLYSKGRNVIAGFKDGMVSVWGSVTAWVGGIATWIKDHKGPVSLDGRLLIPAGRAIMSGFLSGLKSGGGPAWDFVQRVGGKTKDALLAAIGGPFMGGGKAPSNRAGIVALMRSVATAYGWGTGYQWDSLYNLEMGEAGFNPNAQNPTSTAYGLGQFLNSTWAQTGISKTSDPWQQAKAMMIYIARNYGSPAQAWSAWSGRSPHWYAKGTPWVPDDQLAFLHRGEAVLPREVNEARRRGGSGGGALQLDDATIDRLARALARENAANPPQVIMNGRRVDQVLSRTAFGSGY